MANEREMKSYLGVVTTNHDGKIVVRGFNLTPMKDGEEDLSGGYYDVLAFPYRNQSISGQEYSYEPLNALLGKTVYISTFEDSTSTKEAGIGNSQMLCWILEKGKQTLIELK
jgi:hypothetical protein